MSLLPRLMKSFSELERKILLVSLIATLVCITFLVTESYFSATTATPSNGGRYTEGLVGQPRFINPALALTNEVDSDLAQIVYSGLYQYDEDEHIVPDLADGMPQISSDQKQYTIKIKDDVFWHDGQSFTAEDVIFTIHLIQNAAYQSPLRLNWNKVEVSKLDEKTLQINLKEPSAPFLTNLTQGILPKHIWENVEPTNFTLAKYNLQPVGTGPFAVKSIKKSDDGKILSLLLAAHQAYKPRRPYLDEIEFKFYKSYDDLIAAYHGRDILGLGYIPFDKKLYVQVSSKINLHSLSLPRYSALFFNQSKSQVLADKNVRAALAQSLNRQEIIDAVYTGAAQSAYGPIPAGFLGYNPGVEQANLFNLDNAKKLLSDAGFQTTTSSSMLVKTDKKAKIPLEFTITTDNYPLNAQTAEILKKQWEAIGFKVNLQILTIGELQQNYIHPRAYEALLFSESVGGDPDPYAYWHSSQRLDPGLNLAMYANKEADQLLADARSNSDPNFRTVRYQRFQELVANDIPALFIVNSLYIYGVNTKVRGIKLNNIVDQSQRFSGITDWYINTKRVWK